MRHPLLGPGLQGKRSIRGPTVQIRDCADVLVSQLISTTGSRIAKLLDVDSVVHPTMRYGLILRHGDSLPPTTPQASSQFATRHWYDPAVHGRFGPCMNEKQYQDFQKISSALTERPVPRCDVEP